jgi:hypothetical protein
MGNGQLLTLVAVLSMTLPLIRMRRQHGPGRAVVETWEAFARQQGLHNRFDTGGATTYQGTAAGRLTRVRRSPGPDGAGLGLAMVTMYVPEAPFGLKVVSRPRGSPSKPVSGCLQTGDIEFDAVFECSCPDPAPALRYLNSKRRLALMHLLRRADRVCLERRGLSASRSGDLSSKAHLANLFNGAGSAAERLA